MCKIIDDAANERAEMKAYQIALKMLKRGKDSFDEIADLTGLSLEDVQEIAEENNIAVKA